MPENTSMVELRAMSAGELVAIAGWRNGETISVKLKRPSMIEMAAAGEIPNPLLGIASTLFVADSEKVNTVAGEDFAKFAEMMHLMAQKALVAPTYQELHDNNITLTDVQLSMIYNYCVAGVTQLKTFRQK